MQRYKSTNNHKKAQIKHLIKDSFQQALGYKIIQNYCEVEFVNPTRKLKLMQYTNLVL